MQRIYNLIRNWVFTVNTEIQYVSNSMDRHGWRSLLIRSCLHSTDAWTYLWKWVLFCLCWGLTSQSTIFQSCRDGATASWVINQYFRGVKCLAQGHNTAKVGFEPPTSRSGVRHSTTEPPRSPLWKWGPCFSIEMVDWYISIIWFVNYP